VTISRRTALKLISASTVGAVSPRLALAASVPRPLKFRVMRDAFTTNDLWNRSALQSRNLVDAHHS
jgi:hypothetical protein